MRAAQIDEERTVSALWRLHEGRAAGWVAAEAEIARHAAELGGDARALGAYYRAVFTRTLAAAPTPRPAALVRGATSLPEDERRLYNTILGRAYVELTAPDLFWIVDAGELLLPPEHLRYLAPAIAEHAPSFARRLGADFDLEKVAIALASALPLGPAPPIAAELRRALAVRPLDAPPAPAPQPDWRHTHQGGLGFAKLLLVAAELDGASPGNLELLASREPAVGLTLVEHDAGVLNAGWLPERADAAPLYAVDAVIARLCRLARSPSAAVARAARALL